MKCENAARNRNTDCSRRIEPTCDEGEVYVSCANECDRSCDSLTCDKRCRKPDTCVSGCICKPPSVRGPDGRCIERKDCPCKLPIDNRTLLNGESDIRDPCVTYICKEGCIIKEDKKCPVCEWSKWTPYSPCTDACNGTQSRFRTYTGENCRENRTEEQQVPCASNCTIVCSVTSPNGTILTYQVGETIEETECYKM